MSFLSFLQCIPAILAVALWIVLPVQAGNSYATNMDKPTLTGLDLIAQAVGSDSDEDDSDGDSEDSDYDSDSDSEDSDSDSEDDSDADSDEDSDDSDDSDGSDDTSSA